jgi:AAHS family 4-hydroxybenzoate transporter-like MFS transporter
VYFMMNWLPTIAREAGWSLDSALISSVFLNLGGAAGGILLGRLADRFGAFRVLAVGYATGGASLALLGMTPTTTALMLLVFVAGLCTIGGQTAMNAATTTRYPAEFRASALGLALAVGRVGSIVGPTVGGVLLAAHWPLSAVFLAVACPALAVAVIALVLHHLPSRSACTGESR